MADHSRDCPPNDDAVDWIMGRALGATLRAMTSHIDTMTARAEAADAALATARDDALKEVHDLIQRVSRGYDDRGNEAIACALLMTSWNVRALISRDENVATLLGKRVCLNCGRTAPASHDRAELGPECVSPDSCTFDLTPDEAWRHWRMIAHDLRERAERAEAALAALKGAE